MYVPVRSADEKGEPCKTLHESLKTHNYLHAVQSSWGCTWEATSIANKASQPTKENTSTVDKQVKLSPRTPTPHAGGPVFRLLQLLLFAMELAGPNSWASATRAGDCTECWALDIQLCT